MSAEDQSLLERVEMPNIPKDAQKKIAYLQEEFIRAEVEQRTFHCPPSPLLLLPYPSILPIAVRGNCIVIDKL